MFTSSMTLSLSVALVAVGFVCGGLAYAVGFATSGRAALSLALYVGGTACFFAAFGLLLRHAL
jgi:hypothetical protein